MKLFFIAILQKRSHNNGMKIKNDVLVCGEKYLGEVLICDFGVEDVEEDKWYVVLNDGEIVEVKE
jgi:hypothetical protein